MSQRALAIAEKTLGPDDPAVAAILENYASVLRQTARAAEADTLDARAEHIREKYAAKQSVR
jgi:hypothetical protein